MNKAVLGLSVAFLSAACSSPFMTYRAAHFDDLTESNRICEDTKARRIITAEFAGFQELPRGTQIGSAMEVGDSFSRFYSSSVEEFFPSLVSVKFEPTGVNNKVIRPVMTVLTAPFLVLLVPIGEVFNEDQFTYYRLTGYRELISNCTQYPMSSSRDGSHIVRVSTDPLRFAVCRQTQCDGLKEPFGGHRIKRRALCPYCSPERLLFYVDSRNASSKFDEYDCSQHNSSVEAELGIGPHASTVLDTGLYFNKFYRDHYWAVPQRDRESLCKSGGLCFDAPFNAASDPSKIAEESNYTFWKLLMQGITVSKKVQDNWIITKVSLNPTLLCKYAKPISDFYTR